MTISIHILSSLSLQYSIKILWNKETILSFAGDVALIGLHLSIDTYYDDYLCLRTYVNNTIVFEHIFENTTFLSIIQPRVKSTAITNVLYFEFLY